MSKLLIILLLCFLNIDCKVENLINLNLEFRSLETKVVGKKGTLIASFMQNDGIIFKNSQKEKSFNSTISDGTNNHNVECGLWNSQQSSFEIYIFCNIEETIATGNYEISFETKPFTYKEYNVTLKVGEDKSELKFDKIDKDIIDLYSDTQSIIIENSVDSYELKFNIVSYKQEKLFLNYIFLLECKNEKNILKCPITKKDLLAYFPGSNSKNKISYLNTTDYEQYSLLLIGEINIELKDIPKKDVFIGIKKLLVDTNEHDVPIAYETNVTDISNYYMLGKGFDITFLNKNNEGIESEKEAECNFMKYDNNPLYLICFLNKEGENKLLEIQKEIIIKDYNDLYNYRIQPVKNEEIIKYSDRGSFISWYYPQVLDFTKNTGNISILYNIETPNSLNGLTYNENEKDLVCEKIGKHMKKCEISKEHFKGKENGYYFIKHTNHLGKKTTSYEVPPIKVVLSSTFISSYLIYSLVLFLIMI